MDRSQTGSDRLLFLFLFRPFIFPIFFPTVANARPLMVIIARFNKAIMSEKWQTLISSRSSAFAVPRGPCWDARFNQGNGEASGSFRPNQSWEGYYIHAVVCPTVQHSIYPSPSLPIKHCTTSSCVAFCKRTVWQQGRGGGLVKKSTLGSPIMRRTCA